MPADAADPLPIRIYRREAYRPRRMITKIMQLFPKYRLYYTYIMRYHMNSGKLNMHSIVTVTEAYPDFSRA